MIDHLAALPLPALAALVAAGVALVGYVVALTLRWLFT